MAIHDIFSKRQSRELGEIPDVYQYDVIPDKLRMQIYYILRDFFPDRMVTASSSRVFIMEIVDVLRREHGVRKLEPGTGATYWEELTEFIMQHQDIGKVLDAIEVAFGVMADIREIKGGKISSVNAISELNERFKEHGLGYCFESKQIIKISSQFTHAEVVRPALAFLNAPDLQGANQEFLSAHEHYRHQRHKECLVDCCKAFESTLKSICSRRAWAYSPTDTAQKLLNVIFQQQLIPGFLQAHFNGLRSTLEAGVPTVRNKNAAHGQGAQSMTVPESMAAYVLHLTATNIVFLDRLEKEFAANASPPTP